VTLAIAAGRAAPAVWLPLDEAVALCTAWLQEQARANGIRLLILKGATLSHHGLREPRSSSDVDVLIEPPRFEDFTTLIARSGWQEFADTFASDRFVLHSRTFRRDGWPNAIDIHSSWPGFLRPTDAVFELLWQRRESLPFAHRPCDVPDRTAGLVMLALHSLRGSASQQRHERELTDLLAVELTDEERADVASFARATGSDAPLRAVLAQLGVSVDVADDDLQTSDYREWHRKVAHAQGRTASWLIELRRAPWQRKPLILRHGVWPTDRDLLAEHPEVPDRFTAKVWARIVRLIRGLGQLPRVIPALRRR
jgi:hypothetical protein